MKQNQELIKKSLIIAAIFSLAYLFVNNISIFFNVLKILLTTLSPLFVGILIALILGIPLNAIEKRIKKKTKSTRILLIVGIYVVFIALIAVIVIVILPELYESLVKIVNNFSAYIISIAESLNALLEKIGFGEYSVKIEEIMNIPVEDFAKYLTEWIADVPTISEWVSETIPDIVKEVSNIAVAIISIVVSGLMSIIFSIYILANRETYIRQVKKVFNAFLPDKVSNVIIHICAESYITFSNFNQGQLVEITILGTIFFVVMSIANLPFSLLISIIIAITAIIPYFGTTIAMIIGALLILADAGLIKMIIFIIIFIVVQQLENNLIYPRVVGTSVGLPGIWVLLSLLIFGDLLGIVGLIVGVPLMAVIYTLFRELVNKKLKEKESKEA